MQPIRDAVAAKTSALVHALLAVALCAAGAHAQSEPTTGLACLIGKTPANYQTFYLTHTH